MGEKGFDMCPKEEKSVKEADEGSASARTSIL